MCCRVVGRADVEMDGAPKNYFLARSGAALKVKSANRSGHLHSTETMYQFKVEIKFLHLRWDSWMLKNRKCLYSRRSTNRKSDSSGMKMQQDLVASRDVYIMTTLASSTEFRAISSLSAGIKWDTWVCI